MCADLEEKDWAPALPYPNILYVVAWFFSSPEPKAQVNFPDQKSKVHYP